MASKKLGVRAKWLFLSSGAEISDVDEIQNNDTLYISQGEAFYKSLVGIATLFYLHLQINESRRLLPPIILVDNNKDVVEREPNKCQVSTEEVDG
ncbi:hypothetical protein PsorP6_007527 [Peronosclerospora sorghi]|uniref:Uncharacterized protein n=1 Tax=Peronosclerospora sorghi TaxID=230839 RepID=A0ACC0WDH8_9STRA|nr:hypothetical protein PsorP6_007527 [Peronosclerospora sorghi]